MLEVGTFFMGRLEALPSQCRLVGVAYKLEGTGEGVASCPPIVKCEMLNVWKFGKLK